MDIPPHRHPLYLDGRIARQSGKGRNACPFAALDIRRRCLWLGGWHDADMEAA